MSEARGARQTRFGPAEWLLTGLMALLVACGGGDDGGSGGGGSLDRNLVIVGGIVDDGTPTSPVARATCQVRDLEGQRLASINANARGEFQLLVPVGIRGLIACAPPGQPSLELLAFINTRGVASGSEMFNQLVDPRTTVIAQLLVQELNDDPDLDATGRWRALRDMVRSDADLGLLGDASTVLFNGVRGGSDAGFEGLFANLVDNSRLNVPAFAAVASEINIAVARLENTAGRTLEAAYLARFPRFELTLLHHSGGASALRAGTGAQAGFGGVARFAAVLAEQRMAVGRRGHSILVSAGDQIAPSLELQASLLSPDAFFDVDALLALDYDALALGPRDLALGPDVLVEFVGAFDPALPMVASNLRAGNETAIAELFSSNRLQRGRLIEVGGRRVGIVSALRPDLQRVASPRGLAVSSEANLIGETQNAVDALAARGATVIVLLSQQADTAADLALARELDGVDVVVAAGGHALFARTGTRLVPGDAGRVVSPYPTLVEDFEGRSVPVVSTPGSYRYLGRLDLIFDPLGRLLRIDGANSRPIRVAPASEPDGVMGDPEIEDQVLLPLREGIETLRETEVARSNIVLDFRLAAGSDETNFGALLADAVLTVAQTTGLNFGAPNIDVGMVELGSVASRGPLPAGPISRADLYELTAAGSLLTVLAGVTPPELKALLEHALAGSVEGAWLHFAGMTVEWDPARVAGARVRLLALEDGPTLVENGAIVPGAQPITLATTSTLATGAFGHPVVGERAFGLGRSLPGVLDRFLSENLGARIRGTEYPRGGAGRLTRAEEEETAAP
ncbi:MAG: 5'-nucleotidase C-terminal domain-containing protein [Gammaproteobacteria bacterium]|nr:5'-nucleotidase C-terminal domain-containing protein [Gammaproteobacteria bacterium]